MKRTKTITGFNNSSTKTGDSKYERGTLFNISRRKSSNVSRLHPVSIGIFLFSERKDVERNVVKIDPVSKNKIKMALKTAYASNKIQESAAIKNKGIHAYIQKFLLCRNSVIRGVHLNIKQIDIAQLVKTVSDDTFTVFAAHRFNMKFKNQIAQFEFKPTITYDNIKGKKLPSHVSIYKVACEVEPFAQKITQCFNCLRQVRSN